MSKSEKQLAGEAALEFVKDGMTLGLGTGRTAFFAIKKLGELVRNGLSVQCIPTSEQTRIQALKEGIPLVDFTQVLKIDITIDGADEIDSNLLMIKGGGGALFREKIVASASQEMITIVDSSKVVGVLGKFPLPVEVSPFGWQLVFQALQELDGKPTLRKKGEEIFLSDQKNYIIDCDFEEIHDPPKMENTLNQIPGVVANGLFINLATKLIVGKQDSVEIYDNSF